jgi:histone H3/H4
MPKSSKKSADTVASDTTKAKSRGAPKDHPPKSIVQRVARKKSGTKGFQAAAIKLIQSLVVKYTQNIFAQSQGVLANRKGKTLTPRELKVLSEIAQTASATPERTTLAADVQQYENSIKTAPAYLKKKAERAKKREEKKAAKAAAEAATSQQTTTA